LACGPGECFKISGNLEDFVSELFSIPKVQIPSAASVSELFSIPKVQIPSAASVSELFSIPKSSDSFCCQR